MTTQSVSNKLDYQNLAQRVLDLPFLRFLKNASIGAKVTTSFALIVLLLFMSAGASYLGSDQATVKINSTDDVRVPTALVASQAQANLLRMLSDVRGYLALGDQKYRDSYEESTRAFEANLKELDDLAPYLGATGQKSLADLHQAYKNWGAFPAQLFALRGDQLEREPAYRMLATKGTQTGGQVLIDINTMIERQGQREATADNVALLQDMAKFQGNYAAMLSALRGYVTTRNRIFRGEYTANLIDNNNSWDRLVGKRTLMTMTQQTLFDQIGKNRTAFLALPDQIFKDLEGPRWREDLYIFSEQAVPQAETMQKLLDNLVSEQQDLLKTELAGGRQDLARANTTILAMGVFALVFATVLAYIARENIAGPISRLTVVAEHIRDGNLEAQAKVESKDETGVLAETFNNMTTQLRQTLLQVRKEKGRADSLLDVVIPIGVELASEKNFDLLLEKMLLEAKSFCRADAGVIYLKTKDNQLQFVTIRDDSQNLALGGTTGKPIPYATLALTRPDGKPNDSHVCTRVALNGTSVNIGKPLDAVDFDMTDMHVFVDSTPASILAIPLKSSRADEVLGVLQLMDAQDQETHTVIPFDQNLQEMMESFSALAVAALEAYIREQSLQQQIQLLRIEIDEVKRQKQVSEIVDTDFFQGLTERARQMREQRRASKS